MDRETGSSLTFRIEVRIQLFIVHRRRDAGGGNFGFGEPNKGVQDDLSELVVPPIVVEMAPGEAETASA
jgi:hypothetical protein